MNVDESIELFGLNRNFTKTQLEQAYRDLVQVWHPDRYSYNPRLQRKAEAKLKEINNAYELLQKVLASSNKESGKEPSQRSTHSKHGETYSDNIKKQEVYKKGAKHTDGSKSSVPYLKSIFHPSDFSQASKVAFAHALKLALIAKAELSILHIASKTEDVHWTDFPGVRQTLERWGILPKGSSKEDVVRMGLQVQKIYRRDEDPVLSILRHIEKNSTDLIVLATNQRHGLSRWLHKTIAEPLARRSGEMTLFVPKGDEGFVSLNDGTINLQRILIPIDKTPSPQPAVEAASVLARVLGCKAVSFILLYVGEDRDMPPVSVPEQEGWIWDKIIRRGDVVEQILQVATEFSANLVVMTTQGHHGFLDALRGSTTERVLRGSRCPLLAVPMHRK
ncbi:MAG: universal stress protein [Ignavibacteriales bacterium]